MQPLTIRLTCPTSNIPSGQQQGRQCAAIATPYTGPATASDRRRVEPDQRQDTVLHRRLHLLRHGIEPRPHRTAADREHQQRQSSQYMLAIADAAAADTPRVAPRSATPAAMTIIAAIKPHRLAAAGFRAGKPGHADDVQSDARSREQLARPVAEQNAVRSLAGAALIPKQHVQKAAAFPFPAARAACASETRRRPKRTAASTLATSPLRHGNAAAAPGRNPASQPQHDANRQQSAMPSVPRATSEIWPEGSGRKGRSFASIVKSNTSLSTMPAV